MNKDLAQLGQLLSSFIHNGNHLSAYPALYPLLSSITMHVDVAIRSAQYDETVKLITGNTQGARVYKALTGNVLGIPSELMSIRGDIGDLNMHHLSGTFDYAIDTGRIKHGVYRIFDETHVSYNTETHGVHIRFSGSQSILDFNVVDGRYKTFYSSPIDDKEELCDIVGFSHTIFFDRVFMPLYRKLLDNPVTFHNSSLAVNALNEHLSKSAPDSYKDAIKHLIENTHGTSIKFNIGILEIVITSIGKNIDIASVKMKGSNYYSWHSNPIAVDDIFSSFSDRFTEAVYEKFPVDAE